MGVYDQAARRATHEEPLALTTRLAEMTELRWRFLDWTQTQTTPQVEDRDQTADRVAVFEEGGRLWLGLMEFQSRHEPDKLDDLFAEAAQFRRDLRHGPERTGKYLVMPVLVYLTGECPKEESRLEMSSPNGLGVRYVPAIWEVAKDSANAMLDAYELGRITWGILFWVPLMAGADDAGVVSRWLTLVEKLELPAKSLAQLRGIAIVFAELARRGQVWRRILEGWKMTESAIVNEWMEATRTETFRENLLLLLSERFPGRVTADILKTIEDQPSRDLLNTWFRRAATVPSIEDFVSLLRQ